MSENKKDTISVRVTAEVQAALERDVAEFNATNISDAARARLESTLDGPAPARTARSILNERKLTAEVTAREWDNAKAIGTVIAKDDVVEVWTKAQAPIRQAIQQVTNAVDGLSVEQLAQLTKWAEDTLTNLSGSGFE